ncbi:MAG: DUF1385 domain-containing protein [Anaerolineales bacterium]|jgi:uncharacterized protein YqhQ|nr:DUF1385 domain-containing protein [Anaerolineales bacterium]
MSDLKLPTYGGQAVIEGVMMRGKQYVAIAMRNPEDEIVIHKEPLGNLYKSRLVKIPFLRGLVMLWDALILGMRALTISANTQTGDDEQLEGPLLYLTLGISLTIGLVFFFLAPATIGQFVEKTFDLSSWWGNVVEGIVRLTILIGYMWLVGQYSEIKRVFSYHGAEHKTINAFEAGAELTPETVSLYSLEHPRCGTAFLLTLVVFSVVIFTFLGPLPLGLRLISRVIMIPVVAGLAYEYIRWTSNHLESSLVKVMVKPNLALQRLTTREPSLDMLEVSIAAFNAMLAEEQKIIT